MERESSVTATHLTADKILRQTAIMKTYEDTLAITGNEIVPGDAHYHRAAAKHIQDPSGLNSSGSHSLDGAGNENDDIQYPNLEQEANVDLTTLKRLTVKHPPVMLSTRITTMEK